MSEGTSEGQFAVIACLAFALLPLPAFSQMGVLPTEAYRLRGQQKFECSQQRGAARDQCEREIRAREEKEARQRWEAEQERKRRWDEEQQKQAIREEVLRALPANFSFVKDGRTYNCTKTGQQVDCR